MVDSYTKFCEHCGKDLTEKRRHARFCSHSCRALNSAKRQQDDLERLARITNKKIDDLIASGDGAHPYLAAIQDKIERAIEADKSHISS